MSQDSSDEDSEEDEDFARVQFGSRYTVCVNLRLSACTLMGPVHVSVGQGD